MFSAISTIQAHTPTLLGTISTMGEAVANEVVPFAVTAYVKGQGIWPTMKVCDRIKCRENFVNQMKATCSEVFDVGKRRFVNNFTRTRKTQLYSISN